MLRQMTRDEALQRLRKAETEIKAFGVTHLFLFGSVAREEATPTSDVDLFVDIDPDAKFSLFELVALKDFLTDVLGETADVGTRGGLHRLIAQDVEAQAVCVF